MLGPKIPVGKSIGFKVFGIAAISLLLMGVTAVLSLYSTVQLNRQFTTLAEAVIPLLSAVAGVDEDVVGCQLVMERAVHGAGASDPSFGKNLQDFQFYSARIEELLRKARVLAGKVLLITDQERVRIKIARIEPMIDQLMHDHERLQRDSMEILTALKAHQPLSRTAVTNLELDALEMRNYSRKLREEIRSFILADAIAAQGREIESLRYHFVMILAAAAVGILLAYLVSRGLVIPLRRLRASAQAVENGKLDGELPVTSSDEVGDLTRAFNRMVVELRAKERIKETFGQYVDPRVVNDLVAGGAYQATGGQKELVTVFFSDLAGFTQIGERLTPHSLVKLINEYLTVMSESIRRRSGVIDKYIGDCIMAFWAPPFAKPAEQAVQACESALEQFAKLDDFRLRVPDLIGLRQGVPALDIRIGLASGEVVVGSIGSDFARSFTVMGDTVNLGSRLEGTNKVYGTRVLMDATTRDMAGDAIEAREIDSIAVVGKNEPVRIFELLGMQGQLDGKKRSVCDAYEAALNHYRAARWDSALEGFSNCLKIDPSDRPSQVMLERVKHLGIEAPTGWDGVWRMKTK